MRPAATVFLYSDLPPTPNRIRAVEAALQEALDYEAAEVRWEIKVDRTYGERPEVTLTGDGREVDTSWRS